MEGWASIRLRSVVFEDGAALALNKPAGVSVTGERHDTDLVRLAAEAGETLYPVHRIDKITSGVILFAKDLPSHGPLTRQFNKRTVDKAYLAITRAGGLPDRGTIDLPLSTGRKNRVRIAAPREDITRVAGRWCVPSTSVFGHVKTYPSATDFVRVWADERHSLLVIRPRTGRRHQIRVHLAWIGHPIEGDPLFDRTVPADGRTHLHAWRLAFDADARDGGRTVVTAEPGADFWAPIRDRLDGDIDAVLGRCAEAAAVSAE